MRNKPFTDDVNSIEGHGGIRWHTMRNEPFAEDMIEQWGGTHWNNPS